MSGDPFVLEDQGWEGSSNIFKYVNITETNNTQKACFLSCFCIYPLGSQKIILSFYENLSEKSASF